MKINITLFCAGLPPTLLALAVVCITSCESQQCNHDDECPYIGPCSEAVCNNGLCEAVHVPNGEAAKNIVRDDCFVDVCDGRGNLVRQVNDNDIPEDGFLCTADVCSNGVPTHTVLAVGTPCGISDWTCHTDGSCHSCPGIEEACANDKIGEPNETEENAQKLGTLHDSDEPLDLCGVLRDPDDVDWYTYGGADTTWATVYPRVTFDRATGVRVCMYVKCVNGEAIIPCSEGTVPSVSSSGKEGCCSMEGSISIDLWCVGGEETACVWIRVDKPSMIECTSYQLRYAY